MIFELHTDYPPSVNDYYVKTRKGIHISTKGKKFREQVIKDVLEQLNGIDVQDARLKVDLIFWVPDRRRRDIDNLVKPTLDALTHSGVWEDDVQVDIINVYRGKQTPGGATYIRVDYAAFDIPVGGQHFLDFGE